MKALLIVLMLFLPIAANASTKCEITRGTAIAKLNAQAQKMLNKTPRDTVFQGKKLAALVVSLGKVIHDDLSKIDVVDALIVDGYPEVFLLFTVKNCVIGILPLPLDVYNILAGRPA